MPGGAGKEFGISGEGHAGLLQYGQARKPFFWERGFGKKTQGTWRGGSWGRGLPLSDSVRSTSQPTVKSSQQEQGAVKTYKPNHCWQCEGMWHLKYDCPNLKGKALFQGGNA